MKVKELLEKRIPVLKQSRKKILGNFDYDQLMKHVEEWKMDPEKIKMFLEAFKYGVPPEGGFAFGAERMTMQLLGLKNIREASMFPRDMNRIDERLGSDGY